MNVFKKFLICIVLGSVVAGSALAVTEATTPPSVDERAPKKLNISVYPISWLLGIPNLSVEFRINQNSTLSVGGSYQNLEYKSNEFLKTKDEQTLNYVRKEIYADWTLYLAPTAYDSSWFVAPRVGYIDYATQLGTQSGLFGAGYFGYKWFWESGINTTLQAGLKAPGTKLETLGFVAKNTPIDLDFGFKLGLAL